MSSPPKNSLCQVGLTCNCHNHIEHGNRSVISWFYLILSMSCSLKFDFCHVGTVLKCSIVSTALYSASNTVMSASFDGHIHTEISGFWFNTNFSYPKCK